MKIKILIILITILSINNYGQQAVDYFPNQLGHKWFFKTVPLDTLNNEIDSLALYQIDSLAFETTYNQKDAKVVLSKSGAEFTLLEQPYIDTNYVSLSGSTGSLYFGITDFDSLFNGNDTLIAGLGSLYTLLKSFEKWYDIYKFQSTVNLQYQVFRYDTTVTIDTLTLPLRFEVKAKRIADKSLETEIGAFNCKAFIQTFQLSYLIIISPLPPIAIPLLTLNDSVWIAPNNWIVQSITPSTKLDLSILNFGSFSLPGSKRIIINEIVLSDQESKVAPKSFSLEQNFPNPFNPNTTIRFTIPSTIAEQKASLKIFDVLGVEVVELFNELKSQGNYEYQIDAEKLKLSSGIYFYKLSMGQYSQTKKMILIK